MRTTVELPPDLMRKAKALAAERGESLKTLLARAVSSEIGRSKNHPETLGRVQLPLFGSPRKSAIEVTNDDIARALEGDDAGLVSRRRRRRKK